MKTILILGGFGFIGSNIIQYINQNLIDEYQCIIIDKIGTPIVDTQCVKHAYIGDFSDTLFLNTVFSNHQIDVVIHAAGTILPSSQVSYEQAMQSDLDSTIQLLSVMKQYNVNYIIFMSSGGTIYGNKQQPCTENTSPDPTSVYGKIKLQIEQKILQTGIRSLILRISNPYGPYHTSTIQGFINIAIKNSTLSKPIHIWGNSTKDYIYIEDVIDILFRLLRLDYTGIVNIGSGKCYSISDIIKIISNYLQVSCIFEPTREFDAQYVNLDISKLLSLIGDYTSTSLDDGVEKTIKWYILNRDNY